MTTNKKINDAIKSFEQYNNLKIDDYVSDDYEEDTPKKNDNYIGCDVFYNHINEWLEFFDENDKEILLQLLGNYRYYSESKIKHAMRSIIEQLKGSLLEEFNLDSIFFITFPSKNGVKSGGDDLRAIFQSLLLGKIEQGNIIADSEIGKEKILKSAKAIVFLDDVVGSGATMYGNIRRCINSLDLENKKDIKLFVAIIYGREKKVNEKLRDLEITGVKITPIIIEKSEKCFDEANIFPSNEVSKYKEVVKKYETLIKENSKADGKNYILGFNKNQMLISFKYNTPNNTLCNFWKPSKMSMPLFIRTAYTRPNIDELRKYKKNNQGNAYLKGSLKSSHVKNE